MNETIARVFPRRTKWTPDDDQAFVNCPPPNALKDIDAVHVSVAFSWDLPRAEAQAECWKSVGVPVALGGPAMLQPGGDFVPGRYLKQGAVITSRGCRNRCWFCSVPLREGPQREQPITRGWNVMDDNLLGCSDEHIRAVCAMLAEQSEKPMFSGGLEAKLLKPWHAETLRSLRPSGLYFAYDTPDDKDPLFAAGQLLVNAGFTKGSHRLGCYVLVGYPGDTFAAAEARLWDTVRAGFFPYAMLYRDETGVRDDQWRSFQREWVRPQLVNAKIREAKHS